MSISAAEEHHLICPACEHSFKHAVWTIVDTNERPDLFERLQFGFLDDVLCRACGCPVNFDGPLILFNQAARPQVIYCRAGGAGPEWQRREAGRLIGLLSQALGTGISSTFQSTAELDREELFNILNIHPIRLDSKQHGHHQSSAVLLEQAASLGQLSEFFHQQPRALDETFENELLELARLACLNGRLEVGRRYEIYAGLAKRSRAVGSRTAFREREIGAGRWCAKLRAAFFNLHMAVSAQDYYSIVRHADEALGFVDRERDTEIAAYVLGNLGFGLMLLPDVAAVDRAIGCFNETLSMLDPTLAAEDWARTQANLGRAYVKRREGSRRENLERATEHLEQALKIREAQGMDEKARAIRDELDRIRYDLVGTAELPDLQDEQPSHAWPDSAVQSFKSALAYLRLGDLTHEPEALERAIVAFRETLRQIETLSDDGSRPRIRAMLALALRDLATDSRLTNLDSAIEQCRLALAELDRRPSDDLRALVLDTIATIYAERVSFGSADDLEEAIRLAQEALDLRIDDPEAAYLTHTNLGSMYMGRVKGDPVANSETAVHHLRKGLQANDEHNKARSHLFLARILSRTRAQDDAITHAKNALRHYEKLSSPKDRALSHEALGLIYARCDTGDTASNLALALKHFTRALEDLNPRDFPGLWSGTQHNLGVLHRDLPQEGSQHLETALDYFDKALAIRTHERLPLEWAQTHIEIATVHQALASVRPDAFTTHLAKAEHHARASLQVFDDIAFANDHRRCQALIGDLHFTLDDWGEAHEAYSAAIAAGARALASAYTGSGKTTRVAQTDQLFSRDAYCLLKLGSPRQALERLDQGKTRLLSEALAVSEADIKALPTEKAAAISRARSEARSAEAQYRAEKEAGAWRSAAESLSQARHRLNEVMDSTRNSHPTFMPLGLAEPQILSLVPEGGSLVALIVTSKGGAAFIVPYGTDSISADNVLQLPNLTRQYLDSLLRGEQSVDGSSVAGWFTAFRSEPEFCFRCLDRVMSSLWTDVISPIVGRLGELGIAQHSKLLILRQPELGLLPLHASFQIDQAGRRRYLCDDYIISYTPSLFSHFIASARELNRSNNPTSLFAVVDPTLDLHHAWLEGMAIREVFESAADIIEGADATLRAAIVGMQGHTHLHFACHGSYHWRDPESAGLELNDGRLSVADIVQRQLPSARLVTMSACETGISDVAVAPEEYLGLPAAFMQAGASGVLGALWPVDDLSTLLLMSRFYDAHIIGGVEPASALTRAQIAVRDATHGEIREIFVSFAQSPFLREAAAFRRGLLEKAIDCFTRGSVSEARPFAHPYYWAAFCFSGI